MQLGFQNLCVTRFGPGEMCRSGIVPFLDSLGVADRVWCLWWPWSAQAKFRGHNLVVLHCTKSGMQMESSGVMLPKFCMSTLGSS